MSESVDPATRPPAAAAAGQRPGRYARKAITASVLGYAMDGFDLLVLGFALTAISTELHLSQPAAGSLATITLIGAVLGGIVFGVLSDYVGRVRMLTWSILLFGVFTGLTATAGTFAEIAVYRFLAGIGIGAEFGIGMTLAAEAWPARARARATSYVGLGWQGGVLLAALTSALILTHWGWRGLFLVGAFPVLVAFVFRARLREPEIFVRARERPRTFPLWQLFSGRRAIRTSLAMIVLTSVQNFGYYGIMIWLPTYLSGRFGYGLTRSAGWTAVTVLGMAAGILIFGWFADRRGRRVAFWTFQAGAVVSVLVYSQLTTPVALLLGGAVMGAFVNGTIGGHGALLAELYPTTARATAQNVLFNVGRGIGGLAPVVVALVAAKHGFALAIALLSTIYVLAMAAMLLLPERRAATLE
jgi:MFS family permease